MARGLTKLQLEFAREYVLDFNGAAAMMRARKTCGVTGTRESAKVTASKWLTLANVREALKQFSRDAFVQAGIDPSEVLAGLVEIAFSDVGQMFGSDGTLLPVKDMPVGVRRAISSIEIDEIWEGSGEGRRQVGLTKKLRLWSKTESFRMLGEHLKLFKPEKAEPGSGSAPAVYNFYTGEGGTPGSKMAGAAVAVGTVE